MPNENQYAEANAQNGGINPEIRLPWGQQVEQAAAQNGNQYTDAPQGTAIRREVDERELSAWQLDQITRSDSPLMRRVGARAAAEGESRGLMNSSITMGNAQGAMIDAARPFAMQGADVYGRTASENMEAENRMGLANLGYEAQAASREDTQFWQTGENEVLRDWQTGENVVQRDWQSGERREEQSWRTGEREAGQTWTSGENTAQRGWQSGENTAQRAFNAMQNSLNRAWTSGENAKTNALAWAQTQLTTATQLGITRENAWANMYSSIMNNPSENFTAAERQQAIRDMDTTFRAFWGRDSNPSPTYGSGMGSSYGQTSGNMPAVPVWFGGDGDAGTHPPQRGGLRRGRVG